MAQERNLTLRNDLTITPAELVENATGQARLLMNIVEQTHSYQTISGKKYLQVEAWETIGAFNRVHAITRQALPIIRDGEVVGYQADVELLRDGIIVGGASMPCFFTENACKSKEGDAKHKACMSAAQTFATSKAYRMNYSYVAILAGYQPTPAEEMTGEATDERPANLEHWCEEHKTKFFKRGKMKFYAHPTGQKDKDGKDIWCNLDKPIHTVEKVAEEMAEATTSTLEDGVKQDIDEQGGDNLPEGQVAGIDIAWVRETMRRVKFSPSTLVSWLKSRAVYAGLDTTGTVEDIIGRMNMAQKEMLSKELQDRLDMG